MYRITAAILLLTAREAHAARFISKAGRPGSADKVHRAGTLLRSVGILSLLACDCLGPRARAIAAQVEDDHHVAGRLDADHSCYVTASIDHVPFQLLVDTGSDELVFNRSHLRKLGLEAKPLAYSQFSNTSNGVGRSAHIVVHEFRIGGFVMHDIGAVVDYAGMDEPLLGMSVLKYMNLEMGRDGCVLGW